MLKYQNDSTKRLFEVISSLTTEEECEAFFEDLCTIKEIKDMSQRLETAVMLCSGNSYQKISDKLGVSTATISRVNRALLYGSDGYKSAIEKMAEAEKPSDDI